MNFNMSPVAKALLRLRLKFMVEFAASVAQIQASTNSLCHIYWICVLKNKICVLLVVDCMIGYTSTLPIILSAQCVILGRHTPCQFVHHVHAKFATHIIHVIDKIRNYDIFSTYT